MRCFRRLPRRGSLTPGRQLLLSVLAGLLLGLGVIAWLTASMRPMVLAMAQAALSNRISTALGQALSQTSLDYGDLAVLEYNDSGTLTAVTTQMEVGNQLRSQLVQAVLDQLGQGENRAFSIPAGSLTGSLLLSGKGFPVPVEVVEVSRVESGFDSSLTPAGINQTLHRMDLVITAHLVLLIPGGPVADAVTSRITVAETVLLGQVPENYTYFSQFDTAEEAGNAYFDYGAGQ